MAWITKNSGTAKIEQRAEPYLTPAMKADLTANTLPRYETKLAALLPCLHTIQHAYGWVPPQAMLEIAEFLAIEPSQVFDTASFYEEYWLKPKGRHLIQVCRSIACEFCGQQQITDAIRTKLGIDVGETTDDGEFTLIELECLGSCGTAPAALIDEKLYEDTTPQGILEAIDEVRANRNGHHH
jgi:NADH-quinone oxidoreductase subunit E